MFTTKNIDPHWHHTKANCSLGERIGFQNRTISDPTGNWSIVKRKRISLDNYFLFVDLIAFYFFRPERKFRHKRRGHLLAAFTRELLQKDTGSLGLTRMQHGIANSNSWSVSPISPASPVSDTAVPFLNDTGSRRFLSKACNSQHCRLFKETGSLFLEGDFADVFFFFLGKLSWVLYSWMTRTETVMKGSSVIPAKLPVDRTTERVFQQERKRWLEARFESELLLVVWQPRLKLSIEPGRSKVAGLVLVRMTCFPRADKCSRGRRGGVSKPVGGATPTFVPILQLGSGRWSASYCLISLAFALSAAVAACALS